MILLQIPPHVQHTRQLDDHVIRQYIKTLQIYNSKYYCQIETVTYA